MMIIFVDLEIMIFVDQMKHIVKLSRSWNKANNEQFWAGWTLVNEFKMSRDLKREREKNTNIYVDLSRLKNSNLLWFNLDIIKAHRIQLCIPAMNTSLLTSL